MKSVQCFLNHDKPFFGSFRDVLLFFGFSNVNNWWRKLCFYVKKKKNVFKGTVPQTVLLNYLSTFLFLNKSLSISWPVSFCMRRPPTPSELRAPEFFNLPVTNIKKINRSNYCVKNPTFLWIHYLPFTVNTQIYIPLKCTVNLLNY